AAVHRKELLGNHLGNQGLLYDALLLLDGFQPGGRLLDDSDSAIGATVLANSNAKLEGSGGLRVIFPRSPILQFDHSGPLAHGPEMPAVASSFSWGPRRSLGLIHDKRARRFWFGREVPLESGAPIL